MANGIVYAATIDARLIALDQQSGEVLWGIDIKDTGTNANQRETLEALQGIVHFDRA